MLDRNAAIDPKLHSYATVMREQAMEAAQRASVATAAGLCYGAIGTDTGGSIGFPAAANGIVGLKPTYGRVSRYGVFPLAEWIMSVPWRVESAMSPSCSKRYPAATPTTRLRSPDPFPAC